MFDLVCVIPLYGKNCEDTSLRMVASLALQKTDFKVKYLFYYDTTVSKETLDQINNLLGPRNFDYDLIFSEKTSSGYKRNQGMEFARKNAKYIWLVDQDDYLLRSDAIQIIISLCLYHNIDMFKVQYELPDASTIGEDNIKIIRSIPTMPWQYVVKTSLLDKCYFDETLEYGSDVTYSIYLLVMNEYMRVNEDLSVSYVLGHPISSIETRLYFYNYLNPTSYMNHHARLVNEDKNAEMDLAFARIDSIKKLYEQTHSV